MNKHSFVLIAGVCVCALLFYIDPYLGAISAVILAVLAMSLFIMQDSRDLPDVVARLRDDTKGIVLENRGNESAYNIHVAIVPLNIEFDLATLLPEKTSEYPFERMMDEGKAIVGFDDSHGNRITKSYLLSALGKNDDDLLKPMFPLFAWK